MKIQSLLRLLLLLIAIWSGVAHAQIPPPTAKSIIFVSDRFEKNNWDICYMPDVDNPANILRLTTHPAIDNHPDLYIATPPESSKVVWSSNRDGDFEIHIAYLYDMEGTIQQLTFNAIPDRHPHFSHHGQRVVFSAKYRLVSSPSDTIRSECSVPVPPPYWYEGLCIYTLATGTLDSLDIRSADPGGLIWPNTFETWVGHPSFSHDGSNILFSAAVDANGTDWEVYSMDFFNPDSIANLRRHTLETLYPPNANPIKMSAGAHYSHDDSYIYYSSTRTPLGNSNLFRIPASAVNTPVSPDNQVTSHNGNDYVPEPLDDGRVVFVSDLGLNICAPPDSGASNDLDIFIVDSLGENRTNLTDNDFADEMLLIGDEVSWFCGIKPNLSECTYYPKYWNICWFKIFYQMGTDAEYLPNFPKRNLYTRAWKKFVQYMQVFNPMEFQRIMTALSMNWNACETMAWQDIPSWWVIPSLFGRYPDLEMVSIDVPVPDSTYTVGTSFTPQVSVRNNESISETGTVVVRILDPSDNPVYADSVTMTIPIEIVSLSLVSTDPIVVSGNYRVTAEVKFVDDMVPQNNYTESFFRVGTTGVGVDNEIPTDFALSQSYPNPFNPTTTIEYHIPISIFVKLSVRDILGREIAILVNENKSVGKHRVKFDASNLPAGVYFYRMQAGKFQETRKLILLK